MDDLSRILHFVFGEHFIILILLSSSWLLIYSTVSLCSFVARKLFLRVPFYVWIQINRRRLGLPDWRSAVASSAVTLADVPPTSAAEVGRLYSSVDHKISKIRSGRHWIARVLSEDSIQTEMANIRTGDWKVLESDCALTEAISPDPKISEAGLLTSVGIRDIPQNELLGVLFHNLRVGPPPVKKIALFHLSRQITNPVQLKALESVVTTLPSAFEQLAHKTIKDIRHHLMT